jgi:hypothetical protein
VFNHRAARIAGLIPEVERNRPLTIRTILIEMGVWP